jgi:hypothetical protein
MEHNMTLEELQVRSKLIGVEVEKAHQTLYILQGHKQEVDYQISELEKPVPMVEPEDFGIPEPDAPVES